MRQSPTQQTFRPAPPPQEPAVARRPYDIEIPQPTVRRIPDDGRGPAPTTTTMTAQRPGGLAVEPPIVRPPDAAVTRQVTEALPAPAVPPPTAPVTRPPAAPAIKTYNGPRSGVVTWSGQIEKGGTVTLDGKLPGVPVLVDIDTKEFAIVEAPSPANGWNRVVVRSRNKRQTVISLRWTVL